MINALKSIGAFGFLVTVFMAGFGLSSSRWSASNAILQNDLRHAQEELAKARAEVGAAKADFAALQPRPTSTPEAIAAPSPEPSTSLPEASTTPSAKPEPRASNSEKVTLERDQSATLFDGQVVISLVGISYEGDPLRHKATATIGGPGTNNVQIEKQDVGYVARFKDFEVRIVGANTFNVDFSVTRLPVSPSQRR
jgi:hypothetical protein